MAALRPLSADQLAWSVLQATGRHATAEEVDKWLSSWGTEDELPAPECHE